MQSSLPALHSALPAAAPCRAQHFPCALFLLRLFVPRAHSVPHGSPHLRDSALLWSHTSLLPTAQCQLRASIALPAPGCPLVMYPACHWAALHQQQGRTGAPSGQQHGRCWGWKKVKKNGEGEKKIKGEGLVVTATCWSTLNPAFSGSFWMGNGDSSVICKKTFSEAVHLVFKLRRYSRWVLKAFWNPENETQLVRRGDAEL